LPPPRRFIGRTTPISGGDRSGSREGVVG